MSLLYLLMEAATVFWLTAFALRFVVGRDPGNGKSMRRECLAEGVKGCTLQQPEEYLQLNNMTLYNYSFKQFSVLHNKDQREFYPALWAWLNEQKQQVPVCKTGVYVFKFRQKSIGRFLKPDTNGILYIGKGIITSKENRVGKLVNAINKTESSRHDAGSRILNVMQSIPGFSLADLELCVHLTPDHSKIEIELLKLYCEEFGELPPLNRRG